MPQTKAFTALNKCLTAGWNGHLSDKLIKSRSIVRNKPRYLSWMTFVKSAQNRLSKPCLNRKRRHLGQNLTKEVRWVLKLAKTISYEVVRISPALFFLTRPPCSLPVYILAHLNGDSIPKMAPLSTKTFQANLHESRWECKRGITY
jgi:hypothetical protein